ncbi:MAG: phosphotransferase enzyme family protein [Bacteroidota bacterium]
MASGIFMFENNIIEKFDLPSGRFHIHPVGDGHIHKTFKIDCEKGPSYILQKLNTFVFKRPEELMTNALRITEHIRKKIKDSGLQWEPVHFIPTLKNDYLFQDEEGGSWRMFNYISNHPLRVIDQEIYVRAGEAYGHFIHLMCDLPEPPLFETIPHFHDMAYRLQEFDTASKQGDPERIRNCSRLIELVEHNRSENMYLSDLIKRGSLKLRTTHNDAKIDNILFNKQQNVVAVIDLDTVMPGIVHSDFGDAVRSFASTAVEDDPDESAVGLSLEVFAGFSRGFLGVLNDILSEDEIRTLVHAPSMFAFMQGVRFLNDYLMKDKYYKIKYKDHNLVRAKNQFALYRNIKDEETRMREILESCLS